MKQALVLGGGAAGIAAALRLLDQGYAVDLYEAHRHLGGRAFAVPDQRLGRQRDNGPHVMLGCYAHFRALLRRLGSEGRFEKQASLSLTYALPGGQVQQLKLPALPTPMAMPLALLRFAGMRAGEKLRAMRGMAAVLRKAKAGMSFAEWLNKHGQQGAPQAYLWDPLCKAVMNASPAQISAEAFLACLRIAFTGRASAAAIWLPTASWQDILGAPAQRLLQAEGANLHLGKAVKALETQDQRVTALHLANHERVNEERVNEERVSLAEDVLLVSALPWHALARLLPPDRQLPGLQLQSSPLLSLYLDAGPQDLQAIPGPLCYMLGAEPFHYLYRTPGQPNNQLVMIADAATSLQDMSAQAIQDLAQEQLQQCFPSLSLSPDCSWRLVQESRATFLATPDMDSQRLAPGAFPGLQNLRVCGEWTATGLPSTLEGAALSAALAIP